MNCPTCRRRYDGQSEICPRCQTDLSELVAVEAAGRALLARADLLARTADVPGAGAALRQARGLLGGTPEIRRREAVCHLLAGRFPRAFAAWLRQKTR